MHSGELNHQDSDFIEVCNSIIEWLIQNIKSGNCTIMLPAKRELTQPNKGHFHQEPELLFQLAGETSLHFAEQPLRLKSGSLCFTPSLCSHLSEAYEVDGSFLTMVIRPVGSNVYFQLASNSYTEHRQAKMFQDFFVGIREEMFSAQSCRLDYQYFEELILTKSADPAILESAMILYLHQLREVLLRHEPMNNQYGVYVNSAIRMISTNFSNPALNGKFIARQCNCTPNYLSALFVKETGQKLSEYLNEIRLKNGVEMLRSTTLTISEIAFHCGYDSSNYFIRRFKRKYGITPSSYKKL